MIEFAPSLKKRMKEGFEKSAFSVPVSIVLAYVKGMRILKVLFFAWVAYAEPTHTNHLQRMSIRLRIIIFVCVFFVLSTRIFMQIVGVCSAYSYAYVLRKRIISIYE